MTTTASKSKPEIADELAEELRGTCKGLMDAASEEQANDVELMRLLDDRVFECEECGWWEEVSCQSSDGTRCQDCNPDEDE